MATHAVAPTNQEVTKSPVGTMQLKAVPPKTKKKLIRRLDKDYSSLYRRSFQGAFLLLNLWIGTRFYFWVRQYEVGTGSYQVTRPAGVEGWLPIAGLMNLKYWLLSGEVPKVHPAAMFLLITFLSINFFFLKIVC